jgi:hypothetical protein
MELTLREASNTAGCSVAALLQAVRAGQLPVHRRVGRTYVVESLTLMGHRRSLGNGRMWDATVKTAALDLLGSGDASRTLSSSELGRLRRAMRAMIAQDVAHKLGGVRGWHRYRAGIPGARDRVAKEIEKTGPSVLDDQHWADRLSLVSGVSPILFGITRSLNETDSLAVLIRDDEGDLMLREGRRTTTEGQQMADLYMFGQQRESAAAAEWLEDRCRNL